jgi:DNA-binding IclR family transcriptional regulator
MACVNADGSITPTAKSLLQSLESPLGPEAIAAKAGAPLFRVRASLRELQAAGFVAESGGLYRTTDAGRAKI